jgi:hypothetical protein
MKVSVKDLKKLCETILTRAEESGITEIEVDVDYYIKLDDIYDLYVENPELLTGSFVDDWESLQKVLSGENPPTTLDLERLGNVLIIFRDSISKSRMVII